METIMKTSTNLILVTGLLLISSLSVFAKTVTKEIDVKIGSQNKKVELILKTVDAGNKQIVGFTDLRVSIDDETYPVLSAFPDGTLGWCKLLGFKYLNYSNLGYSDFEHDVWERGVVLKEGKAILVKINRNETHIINSLNCTDSKNLEY
jgi:hypothetical protein